MNRILIFSDEAFPGYRKVNLNEIQGADVCSATQLAQALEKEYDVFVNLHGSCFPYEAVRALFAILRKGKGYLQIGGAPLTHMCRYSEEQGGYQVGTEQMAYHRKLNIHSILAVSQKEVSYFEKNPEIPVAEQLVDGLEKSETLNFVMTPTKDAYVEEEWGSVGSMDARIVPLIRGMNGRGQHISSPVVLIENRAGAYRGGRWIFINAELTQACLADADIFLTPLIRFVAAGSRELWVKPSFPLYYPGERPTIKLTVEDLGSRKGSWKVALTCRKDGRILWEKKAALNGSYMDTALITAEEEAEPGFYELESVFTAEDGELQKRWQGFHCYSKELMTRVKPAACGKDYMIIDGVQTPIVGTTYMSSSVSRSFLHLPNVYEWLWDMQEMQENGINWIRTGIWCNHRTYMLEDGHFDEHILRAVDAFIQTAAMVNLHVTFNFFTFVPEAFEGSHPYLDRRSIEAQKRFIASVVARHKESTNVDWDLINEPFTSDHPLQKRKPEDVLEDEGFRRFMKEKYQDSFRMLDKLDLTAEEIPDFDSLPLPAAEKINFEITDMAAAKNGIIWKDYLMFRMQMFENWAREMRTMIQKICPGQLVTAGQDEALHSQKPSNYFMEEEVDYTCQHSWWQMDDLVWDTRFGKSHEKPLLVQETGIMYTEAPNGQPRRSEQDLHDILEKKFAYAYGTRCAGAIHWLWNTNYFMNNANESNIGAIRCDGSRKPEFTVYRDFADFFGKTPGIYSDVLNEEQIAVIYPFSNDFSNRKFAEHATTHLTKLLTYELKLGFMGISEFHLEPLRRHPFRVIFVPAAHHFDEKQFQELLQIVGETGSTLVFTGPIARNEYFGYSNRAEQYLGRTTLSPLAKYETVVYKGQETTFSFDRLYCCSAFKETASEGSVLEVPVGKGKLLWFGVPLELTADGKELAGLYRAVLADCGVVPQLTISGKHTEPLFASAVRWEKGTLYTLVNEASERKEIVLADSRTKKQYHFSVPENASFLFITDPAGKVLSVYRNQPVEEKTE